MANFEYEVDGHVAILTMDTGENRFNFPFFEAFNDILDEIERDSDTSVLVTRSSHEKIWSNGIDLDWFIPPSKKKVPKAATRFLRKCSLS